MTYIDCEDLWEDKSMARLSASQNFYGGDVVRFARGTWAAPGNQEKVKQDT